MLNLEFPIVGNRLSEVMLRYPCTQKILMVTDDFLDFGTGGFGLSEFVEIIRSAGHAVTTAHRHGRGPNLSIAGNFNFATSAPAASIGNYDQIWLFGFSTSPLSSAEQTKVAQFMAEGGGVFATGDHETIGAGMGTSIPRVRSMRNWSGIPMVNPGRHDTVVDAGVDSVKQFDDQADAVAQRIFPVFFSNGGPDSAATSWSVHPVLRHISGAVDRLPDHPHESECLAASPVAGNFAGVEEWPAPLAGGARIAPQVVAVSISGGRFIVSGAPTATGTKPPVRPRCFGAISAYDGDAANVGRVVCDATWHHFVNINLNGAGASPDSTGAPRTGLYEAGAPTTDYLKIRAYYLNTARWLAPRGRRTCWPFVIAALARFDFEMMEFRLPLPHPSPWAPLLRIGQLAEDIVDRNWGPGTLAEAVDAMLSATETAPALQRMLRAQQVQLDEEPDKRAQPSLLPLQDMRRVVMGSVVNLIAHKLPTEEVALADHLKKGNDKMPGVILREGINAAELAIDDYLQRALKHTTALSKTLLRKH